MIQTNSSKRSRNNGSTEPSKRQQVDTTTTSGSQRTDDKADDGIKLDSPQTPTTAVSALWKSISLTTLDMKALYQYIKNKGDLGVTNDDGYGLVYLAAQNNSMEALRLLLLTSDLDVNTVHGPHHELALHAAASVGSFDALELLLEHGSTVDRQDSLGHTPLTNTLFAKAANCSDLLIEAGAALDTVDTQGNTLLHLAVSNQCIPMISRLIEKGVAVDQNNNRGLSPLAIAIGLGYKDAVRALLDGGADVNGKTRHATVLHHAVTWNRMDALEALVDGGAIINTVNGMEETPLLVAVQQRKIDMVRYLREKGADPAYGNGSTDASTNAPLLYAANHGYTQLCSLLITPDTSTYFIQMAADMSDRASFTATATYLRNKVQERQDASSGTTTTALVSSSASDAGALHSSSSQSTLSTPITSTTTTAPSVTKGMSLDGNENDDDMMGSPNRLFDTDFSSLINTFSDDEDIGGVTSTNSNKNPSTNSPSISGQP
ncbi:unnamed protein product [Absidia cylindrospora]